MGSVNKSILLHNGFNKFPVQLFALKRHCFNVVFITEVRVLTCPIFKGAWVFLNYKRLNFQFLWLCNNLFLLLYFIEEWRSLDCLVLKWPERVILYITECTNKNMQFSLYFLLFWRSKYRVSNIKTKLAMFSTKFSRVKLLRILGDL